MVDVDTRKLLEKLENDFSPTSVSRCLLFWRVGIEFVFVFLESPRLRTFDGWWLF